MVVESTGLGRLLLRTVMVVVGLVCSCVVVVAVSLVVVVVVCVDLSILFVGVVVVGVGTVVRLLVRCTSIFAVVVFVVVDIFPGCGDFLLLYVDLFCQATS